VKKHELLVPAGNMECLYQAVHNGCDAVYLACKSFGARKFAANFTNEEVVEAIKFCHLYGVKVFVTMNTLVKNSEVESFIEQVRFLHKNGVDALIVQDFGMICYLREKFPNLEIHASTQANISCREVCDLYYKLGVKRVVFAREMSIDEINKIDVPIEKEVFIHGALCISYSGCCLMSSMLGGRSGNRGECAGVCRMPFSLIKDGKIIEKNKYLLSTKELNTSSKFSELLNSNIYSFKIEGRMKSPLYVGFITRFYRRLIDGESINYEEEIRKLKTIFNREFTVGRLFHEKDNNFMNIKSPNHIGLEIGKVISIHKKYVKIKLNNDCFLHQYDAIRFTPCNIGFIVNYLYDNNNNNLIRESSNTCFVDYKDGISVGDIVYKTQDYLLEEEFKKMSFKKIPIFFHVYAKVGEKLKIDITDSKNTISCYGDVVERAKSAPIQTSSIREKLSKLGDSPFICLDCSFNIDDDIFIPIKAINNIRRELVSLLMNKRMEKSHSFVENDVSFTKNNIIYNTTSLSCMIYTKEQLEACLENNVSRIYIHDSKLYEEYKNYKEVYSVSSLISTNSKSLISFYRDYHDGDYVGNYLLNVTNIYTAYYLTKIGLNNICLSVELSLLEIQDFIKLYEEKFGTCNFEMLGYGRVHNMIIKGNVLNIDKDAYDYSLIDSRNRIFPVYYDGNFTHILNYIKRNDFNSNICIRLDFYNEEREEVEKIVKEIQLLK